MKNYMTPEEHARLHRRRARQALGLLVAVLVLIGAVGVLMLLRALLRGDGAALRRACRGKAV